MKISMHLLEQWLRKEGFEVEASIPDGRPELQVVRITDTKGSSGVACISAQNAKNGLIKIINQDDVIVVRNSAVENVFNTVSAAFEYYNAWEMALLRSVFEGASLQDILDIAQLAFTRPMLIQNSQYEIVAITASYGSINAIWEAYHKGAGKDGNGGKPFHLWFSRDRFNAMSERVSLHEPTILTSLTNHGKFILANLFMQDIRVGHITMYEQNRPFYPSDLQLMKVFQEIVTFYICSNRSVLFERSVLDAYLDEKLGGTTLPGENISLRTVYKYTGWSDEDSFAVAQFSLAPDAEQEEFDWIQNEINLAVSDVYTVFTPNGVAALFHLDQRSDYDEITERLDGIHYDKMCGWGISRPFHGLQELENYGRIASLVAEEARRRNVVGLNLRDAGMGILLRDENCRELLGRLMHPEYMKLRRYDSENHTQLTETLYWYLYSNGSYTDMAARMNTHRSTAHYRMAKIFELVNSHNLETVESRLLYQLSYLCEQQN